jgi:hypothetical protein
VELLRIEKASDLYATAWSCRVKWRGCEEGVLCAQCPRWKEIPAILHHEVLHNS